MHRWHQNAPQSIYFLKFYFILFPNPPPKQTPSAFVISAFGTKILFSVFFFLGHSHPCNYSVVSPMTYDESYVSILVAIDTSFMYMIGWLCMLKIYQTRHPDINAQAHIAYFAIAGVICLAVIGVVGFQTLLFNDPK